VIRLAAFDTSTRWCAAALLESSAGEAPRVVAQTALLVTDSQAARLMHLFDRLVSDAGWSRGGIDAFAATRGPGSFTGIRVGLGTVRGLALASGRPALGVGTLVSMAEALGPAEGDRVPLLDAGRGEVFGARFDARSVPPVERLAPWIGPPEHALDPAAGTAILFGPGAETHATRLREAGYEGTPLPAQLPVAAAAGRLALLRLAAGAVDGEGLSPVYLQPPDAVRKLGS
jgi:tRNA threonylcarbamoyladenosine biosynthesis protein TsaB